MAAWLLREVSKGHASPWAPYLATLPPHVPLPSLFPLATIQQLQWRPTEAMVRAFWRTVPCPHHPPQLHHFDGRPLLLPSHISHAALPTSNPTSHPDAAPHRTSQPQAVAYRHAYEQEYRRLVSGQVIAALRGPSTKRCCFSPTPQCKSAPRPSFPSSPSSPPSLSSPSSPPSLSSLRSSSLPMLSILLNPPILDCHPSFRAPHIVCHSRCPFILSPFFHSPHPHCPSLSTFRGPCRHTSPRIPLSLQLPSSTILSPQALRHYLFHAIAPIAPGADLLTHYGVRSSHSFLLSYGFSPHPNSFDSLPLFRSSSDLLEFFAEHYFPGDFGEEDGEVARGVMGEVEESVKSVGRVVRVLIGTVEDGGGEGVGERGDECEGKGEGEREGKIDGEIEGEIEGERKKETTRRTDGGNGGERRERVTICEGGVDGEEEELVQIGCDGERVMEGGGSSGGEKVENREYSFEAERGYAVWPHGHVDPRIMASFAALWHLFVYGREPRHHPIACASVLYCWGISHPALHPLRPRLSPRLLACLKAALDGIHARCCAVIDGFGSRLEEDEEELAGLLARERRGLTKRVGKRKNVRRVVEGGGREGPGEGEDGRREEIIEIQENEGSKESKESESEESAEDGGDRKGGIAEREAREREVVLRYRIGRKRLVGVLERRLRRSLTGGLKGMGGGELEERAIMGRLMEGSTMW
ncbi:unnamed protein product [Closterium sp. NIES-65]|nr:unnamed protein product [Closterium sp. NIES-65]